MDTVCLEMPLVLFEKVFLTVLWLLYYLNSLWLLACSRLGIAPVLFHEVVLDLFYLFFFLFFCLCFLIHPYLRDYVIFYLTLVLYHLRDITCLFSIIIIRHHILLCLQSHLFPQNISPRLIQLVVTAGITVPFLEQDNVIISHWFMLLNHQFLLGPLETLMLLGLLKAIMLFLRLLLRLFLPALHLLEHLDPWLILHTLPFTHLTTLLFLIYLWLFFWLLHDRRFVPWSLTWDIIRVLNRYHPLWLLLLIDPAPCPPHVFPTQPHSHILVSWSITLCLILRKLEVFPFQIHHGWLADISIVEQRVLRSSTPFLIGPILFKGLAEIRKLVTVMSLLS